jgi:hypothetical protein
MILRFALLQTNIVAAPDGRRARTSLRGRCQEHHAYDGVYTGFGGPGAVVAGTDGGRKSTGRYGMIDTWRG